ncbi:ribonuclease III, partial [Pleomassaria siparia CBS 279.74]
FTMSIDSKVTQAETILGYIFTHKLLCAEAIQMSAPREYVLMAGETRFVENNKRLAVLGDTALANALCKLWYQKRDVLAAAWTELRNDILGNAGLSQRGDDLGIGSLVISSHGYNGPASAKMVATTFEALVGAVYLDGGDDAVMHVVEHLGLNQHPSLQNRTQAATALLDPIFG